jgi:soluble lytic murein transglycosylase-like protein
MGIDQSSGSDYRSMAYQDAVDAGIDPNLYVRQINQESGFDPNVVSSAGAIGIAQITQATADDWQVNPWDPVASLRVAAQHMAWYYQHYGNDYAKALSCYNAGCGRLEWAISNCSNWLNCMPSETRSYIISIIG